MKITNIRPVWGSFVAILCAVLAASGSLSAQEAGEQPPLDPQTALSSAPLSALQKSYDVLRYALDLEIMPGEQAIAGTGTVEVRVVQSVTEIELDFDSRFEIVSINVNGVGKQHRREVGKLFVLLGSETQDGDTLSLEIAYSGKPYVAENAPWDGGFVWSETADGSPWIATALQSDGCDLWFPCKDHYSDKPETVDLKFTVPGTVSAATNGVLVEVQELENDRKRFHWRVTSPINHYNIALNVGPYVRIQESYTGVNGETIPIEFWALKENEQKARDLIENDLRKEIEFYERRLGPFPWGDAKMGFAETPHLGMEHQSIIAYGNQYKRDKYGYDWLLQHELAHEWFGNVMTHASMADAWLHEGTGAYMQSAYSKELSGEAAYAHRMYQSYLGLNNCKPVVAAQDADADQAFHIDIYGKGAWVLHTLRNYVGEEVFWRSLRRLIYDTSEPWSLTYPIAPRFRSTEDFVRITSEEAGQDLQWFFDAYLYTAALPVLKASRTTFGFDLEWEAPGEGTFVLPVPVTVNGERWVVEMKDGVGFLPVGQNATVLFDPDMEVLRALPIIGTCEEQAAEHAAQRAKRKEQHTEEFGWDKAEEEQP